MTAETKSFASEAGHWYEFDGTPRYTVIAKSSGQERPTTLRDARANNWLPSVTTVIGIARKPGLEVWLEDQALQSAFTTPLIDGETYDAWKARVKAFAREESMQARDRGTVLHGAIECAYRGEPINLDLVPIVQNALDCITVACGTQQWLPERSFGCIEGYGGKVDLHSSEWVIDFKTKANVGDKERVWDEHLLQLAAYRCGLGLHGARCAIVYVDRDNPIAKFVEVNADGLRDGLAMFRALLLYWKIKNKYWPELPARAAA